jgi:Calcineurin-like phosphoesterase
MNPPTIAIDDIHGCSSALDALLNAIRPRPEDCIVALGDYINRGPDSRGVIEKVGVSLVYMVPFWHWRLGAG